nr:hypothetical protein [Fimbriiglobus sp.]
QSLAREIALVVSLLAAVGFALAVWRQNNHGQCRFLPPLFLGLIWLTLFGPATEVNTYSVLAPVVAVLVFTAGRWRWLTWAGTALLLAVEVRAAFPSGGGWELASLQPIGAALLIVAAMGWRAKPKVGSGTGGI